MRRTGWGRASLLVVAVAVPLLPAGAQPGRIDSDTAEIRLPSVAIGKSYSTWRLAQAPVLVRNTSDDTVSVHVEVVVPERHEVRAGALPLPDQSWVQIVTTRFVLPPHSAQRTDVRLTLPYEPELAGHTYEVDLWAGESRGDGTPRLTGQRHRLLFTVEMDYRDDTEINFASRGRACPEQI